MVKAITTLQRPVLIVTLDGIQTKPSTVVNVYSVQMAKNLQHTLEVIFVFNQVSANNNNTLFDFHINFDNLTIAITPHGFNRMICFHIISMFS